MEQTTTRRQPGSGSDLVPASLRFARRMHLGQYRKQNHRQFVEHPIAVAEILATAGCDDRVIAAAHLHDVVEKADVGLDEIALRFGDDIASIVAALTEDPSIDDYCERKRALRAQVLRAEPDAILIYAADRVANLRDWVAVDASERDAVADRLGTTLDDRLSLWSEDLDELAALDPDLPFLGEMEIELRALRAERP